MNLSDIAFELTKASMQLQVCLNARDVSGAQEASGRIHDLILPLGEIASGLTAELDERNARISAQRAPHAE